MAQRRMFSPDIVNSDAFLEMPPSTQALYFQLGMKADDDGFVNPRMVMRMMGSSDDELKVLMAKRFVLQFENGVIVIKHWRVNNLVRKDWYRPTIYRDEKKRLFVKDNGAYTFDEEKGIPLVNEPLTQVRLGKVSIDNNTDSLRSSDLPILEVQETPETPARVAKDPIATKAARAWHAKAKSETGREPSGGLAKTIKILLNARESLSWAEIRQKMNEWFDTNPEAHDNHDLIQVTKCFSAYQIDKFLSENE